jgi:hypothetical protein
VTATREDGITWLYVPVGDGVAVVLGDEEVGGGDEDDEEGGADGDPEPDDDPVGFGDGDADFDAFGDGDADFDGFGDADPGPDDGGDEDGGLLAATASDPNGAGSVAVNAAGFNNADPVGPRMIAAPIWR